MAGMEHGGGEIEFNLATATLYRIDKGLKAAGEFALIGKAVEWYLSLDYVYRQISPFLSFATEENKMKEKDTEMFKADAQRQKTKNIVYNTSVRTKGEPTTAEAKIYESLHDYEKMLVKFCDVHNLYMKKSRSFSEMVEEI